MADSGEADPPDGQISSGQDDPHVAAVQADRSAWQALDPATLAADLRAVISGAKTAMPETLVWLSQRAHDASDRKMLNLAFEALCKRAAPSLSSLSWGSNKEDRKDTVQEILTSVLAAVRRGKSEFAQNWFAAFASRASISLYRKHRARLEGSNTRVEPTPDRDPVDELPARAPSQEAKAALSRALDRLSPKQRSAFVQYHVLGLNQEEIARHHGVDVRTIRTWLKTAAGVLGLQGEEE